METDCRDENGFNFQNIIKNIDSVIVNGDISRVGLLKYRRRSCLISHSEKAAMLIQTSPYLTFKKVHLLYIFK